jgi:hypothetical protein
MTDGLVVARTYSWIGDAVVACSVLRGAGVPARLRDQHTVRIDWTLSNAIGGVKVVVPTAQLDEARLLLDHFPVAIPPELIGDPCPCCGSLETLLTHRGRRPTFVTWLIFGLPLWRDRSSWTCAGCGRPVR